MGRLGTPWVSLGVSWARLGGVLAVSFWWLGGVLALGAVLGPFWEHFGIVFGSILEPFSDRFKLVLGISRNEYLNLLEKYEHLRGQSTAPDAKKAHKLKLC